jgi:hypothetical protein
MQGHSSKNETFFVRRENIKVFSLYKSHLLVYLRPTVIGSSESMQKLLGFERRTFPLIGGLADVEMRGLAREKVCQLVSFGTLCFNFFVAAVVAAVAVRVGRKERNA